MFRPGCWQSRWRWIARRWACCCFSAGGANNPLVTLYLLPLVYAALTLPRRQAWWLAVLAVADYTFLMDFSSPLPGSHSDPALAFRLHTVDACGPPSAAQQR